MRAAKTEDLLAALPAHAAVLDIGCLGFRHIAACIKLERADIAHSGVDYCLPEEIPTGVDFRMADLNHNKVPFSNDQFDLVIASHIIEHLEDPARFYGECLRVLKPGGALFLACPSERTIWMPGFPFGHSNFHSLSFFDDPTHSRRPFSPQSLVRLALYYGCSEVAADYNVSWTWRLLAPFVIPLAYVTREAALLECAVWRALGWESVSVARKGNFSGTPPFNYYIPNRAYGPILSLVRRLLKRQ